VICFATIGYAQVMNFFPVINAADWANAISGIEKVVKRHIKGTTA
jgi:hypothetical protein